MAQNRTNKTLTIGAAGVTTTFSVNDAIDIYDVKADTGAVVLAGNVAISAAGTPSVATTFSILIGGGFTLGANTFTVFGQTLTTAQVLYPGKILAYYNGSAWDVYYDRDDTSGNVSIQGADIVAGTVVNAAIATNAAIALSKLANLAARGYAIRGGVNGVVEAFNAVTSGNLMMGNGTDVVSQAMSGDVTINGSGVTTIGTGKVTIAMLAYTPQEYFEASLTITTAQILALGGTALTIVASPGAGKYIEVVSASSNITFVSAAYATNTTLQLICDGADIAQMQDQSVLIATVSKITKFQHPTGASAGQSQIIANTALMVKVATGNPITGDSGIKVKVVYRIVTV